MQRPFWQLIEDEASDPLWTPGKRFEERTL